jgi:hypothetical protein
MLGIWGDEPNWSDWGAIQTRTATTTSSAPPPATPVTPTLDPKIQADILYDKPIALSVLGLARIGGSIIFGPYFDSGKVTFGVSFGLPANPDGTRIIYDIAFDSMTAWTSSGGGTLPGDGTFAAESFTFRFYGGRLDQAVDPLEELKFPGKGIAYRPQMVLFIQDLPYAQFVKPVPYVSCLIGDTTDGADPDDGVNLGDALEQVAWSPWAGYTSAEFEAVNISDVVPALLMKDNFNIVQLSQSVTRAYRNIDLLQSDKLRVKDRGSNVTADLVVTRDRIIAGDTPVTIARSEPSAQPRELELATVDPDQDYTIVTSLAKRPRDPVVVSAAVGKQTMTLPLVLDAATRQALVTFAQYYEENARKRVQFRVSAFGFEIEPGDLVALSGLADGVDDDVWKVIETTHGANYVVEVTAEAMLRCRLYGDTDPLLPMVVLLMGFEGNMTDESPHLHGNATVIGAATLTSTSPIFGSQSLVLDATSDADGIYYTDHADWQLATSNSDEFCIEVWVTFISTVSNTTPVDSTIIGVWGGGVPITSWMIYVNTTGSGELTFLAEDSTGTAWTAVPVSSGLTWVSGTRYYVRVDKDAAGKARLYRAAFGDAIAPMIGSATPANSSISDDTGLSAVLSIGCNSISGGRTWPGKIDEIRITKGSSRSASDSGVSVPVEAFPRD